MLRDELVFTMRVAVMLEQQIARTEIARRLDVKASDVTKAVERLRAIAPAIEQGEP